MCGRFGLTRPDALLAARFGVDVFPPRPPRFNVAPGEEILVVAREGARNVARTPVWGVAVGSAEPPRRLVNVRAESLGAWTGSNRRAQRCLVPADVFYEWKAAAHGRGPKQPFAVAMRSSEPFALGAICDSAAGGDSSCAILTTEPNAVVAPIHDRMPVIVPADAVAAWLDADSPPDLIRRLTAPYAASDMAAWPVSLAVNRAANDSPAVLEPAEPLQSAQGELGL